MVNECGRLCGSPPERSHKYRHTHTHTHTHAHTGTHTQTQTHTDTQNSSSPTPLPSLFAPSDRTHANARPAQGGRLERTHVPGAARPELLRVRLLRLCGCGRLRASCILSADTVGLTSHAVFSFPARPRHHTLRLALRVWLTVLKSQDSMVRSGRAVDILAAVVSPSNLTVRLPVCRPSAVQARACGKACDAPRQPPHRRQD